ncbi:Rpn family recombination-promoting nuclease/putative transposase [Oceanobacillus luteolus]|uniref:Rpn family recombination-promoting nuclease/putative transposase n=1 Tax=Oceanobacillus luteolus TaxID=1274358 RepID=UPI002041A20F|nr:Rpn family recombination-promoting nuclease/putative transposase [Oceanobacillus luteolus]MCM3741499.1 Rpn family recombination-promoting nuclease/putative transposase [Oceanobacillus luteolus]
MPLVVREVPRIYMKHDQLYKELINTFFKEFIEAFFPDVYEHLDFQAIKPISEEVYTDVLQGENRRLDIVVETKLRNTDVVIIVHIEPQSYVQREFHERMFRYFSLLYNKYRKPIVPIAVFSYKENWEKNRYTMEFPFFHVLTFHYLTLHLRKKNWRDYIRSDNPAAAALLSKMGYNEDEKIEVKKEFLRMITRMELDPARQRLIYGFFETYLKLSKKEEDKLMEEIRNLPEAEKILEIPISYEEKGKELGKEIGKEIGKKEVATEMLKKGLSVEFISDVTHLEVQEIERLKKQI